MGGAKRQHQLSRTAVGWFPTKVAKPEPNELQPIDEVDGLSREQLDSIKLRDQDVAPLTAQQTANDEKCKWGGEWASGDDWIEPDWAEFECEDNPVPVSVAELRGALMSFPCGSGLGWDGIHPRALDRLDDALLALLIDLLMICEMLGK